MKIKNLNKKGFTLIELLAVIVILAIILVIAVPSVLNIQKNAKKGTTSDQTLLIKSALEKCWYAEQTGSIDGSSAASNCSYSSIDDTKFNDYFTPPAGATLTTATINGDGKVNINYTQNGWTCTYNNTTTNQQEPTCTD